MANLSKIRRDKLLAYIERLKLDHTDDESLMLFNELENALTEKRYGLVFEEHTEEVDELLLENVPVLTADADRRVCKDAAKPWNFLIEGDNLQALYLLEKTHKGKVDCIYIDPPYNTGAKDWKYNNDYVGREDDYRHSKWLSMIKSRLQIAKKLLNPKDSVLIVTIDEKEYLHLGCLLEEMFPTAKIQMVSSVINSKGIARDEFFRVNEYLFIVRFGECMAAALPLPDEWRGNIKTSTTKEVRWGSLMRSGSGSARSDSPGCFYPVFISKDKKHFCGAGDVVPLGVDRHTVVAPEGQIALFPIHDDGSEGRWQYSRDKFLDIQKRGFVRISTQTRSGVTLRYISEGWQNKVDSGQIAVLGRAEDGSLILDDSNYVQEFVPCNQWWIPSHNATEFGSKLLQGIIGKRFSYPKSLYAVRDVIKFFVVNKPDAIIIDFFAGSGTTQHAVNLLNAEDNGNRRCIMITNNEVSIEEATMLKKQGYAQGDAEWERLGIARYVTWPRTVCSIEGKDINGKPLKGDYLAKTANGADIAMKDGFTCNVKYLKCDWVPRVSEDSLAEQLMEHIQEMIELEHGIEVDGNRIIVVLSEEDADEIEKNWNEYSQLSRIYMSKNVLLTTKQNELFNTVEMHTIPDYYFDIELKEVGESW